MHYRFIINTFMLILCLLVHCITILHLAFPADLFFLVDTITPFTPHKSIFIAGWCIIYVQWIYSTLHNENTLSWIDYSLNILWLLCIAYKQIIPAYCLALCIILFLFKKQPNQILYLTWILLLNVLTAYLCGGFFFALLNILLYTAITHPVGRYLQALENMEQQNRDNDFVAARNSILPVYLCLCMFSLFLVGIIMEYASKTYF